MKNIQWLDALSIKATYGLNGSAPRSATTAVQLSVASVADTYTGQNYGTVYAPANPNLGWETTKVANYGMDFSVFNRRLN